MCADPWESKRPGGPHFPGPALQKWGKEHRTLPMPQSCRALGAGVGRERGEPHRQLHPGPVPHPRPVPVHWRELEAPATHSQGWASISAAPIGLGISRSVAEPRAKLQRCQQNYLHCLQRENQYISHPRNTEILFSIIWKSN